MYSIEGAGGAAISVNSQRQIADGKIVEGIFHINCVADHEVNCKWTASANGCECENGDRFLPTFLIDDGDSFAINARALNFQPFAAVVAGRFKSDKGCLGILDTPMNEFLLPEFANKCEETEKYEGKSVEINGIISKTKCPANSPCRDGFEINNIESIKIIAK
jgi:hypothetical protein